MISNNKKIEVEKNKFAEKERELESVKQQLESKVQELENKITLGKEAAGKEVEVLNNQLNELTQEKQGLEKEVVELKAKVKGSIYLIKFLCNSGNSSIT
jgi:chromosome segregation ATPase